MRIGLEVWSSDYAQVESTCRRAERLGFDAFYYGESPNDLNLECWSVLAALARATSTIRLGPVIANVLPTYRSPALLARQAAAVDTIAGGRLDFRTGVGAAAAFGRAWWGPVGVDYPAYGQRLGELAAALDALPGLWGPERTIPITVAASGDRAMDLVAEHAAVWETSFCRPDEFAARRNTLTAKANRPITCALEIDGFVAGSGRDVARLLDRVRADRGAAEDLDAILAHGLVGQPPEVAAQLGELAAAGVDQVVVALHDPHDPEALDALAAARDQVTTSSRAGS